LLQRSALVALPTGCWVEGAPLVGLEISVPFKHNVDRRHHIGQRRSLATDMVDAIFTHPLFATVKTCKGRLAAQSENEIAKLMSSSEDR
jgi:hypothetical protein